MTALSSTAWRRLEEMDASRTPVDLPEAVAKELRDAQYAALSRDGKFILTGRGRDAAIRHRLGLPVDRKDPDAVEDLEDEPIEEEEEHDPLAPDEDETEP